MTARVTKGQSAGPSDVLVGPALKVRLQKTRLCQFHLRSSCKDGSSCRFAHGPEELCKLPDLSKTSMCPNLGKCNKPDCQYAHSSDEIRTTNFCHKTTQCMWYAMGKCRKGTLCRFAHGETDRNPSLNEVIARETQLSKADQEKEKAAKKKKEKVNQENKEPMFIQSNMTQPLVDPVCASQAYLPYSGMAYPLMPPLMGYPMAPELTGAWNASLMQGTAYDSMYNPMAMQMLAEPSQAETVKALSKHIKSLTMQVRKLEDTMHQTLRNDSDSTFSGPTSAASGSSSNDDLVHSDASDHFLDDLDNFKTLDSKLA